MNKSELEKFADSLVNFNPEQLYREALRAQMEINWDFAKEYMKKCESFQEARSVVDLGCGPGDFIIKLAKEFSDKIYAGYDLNVNFIETAKNLSIQQGLDIQFDTFDLMDSKWPSADFTILRNVLQHIKDLSGFIEGMDRSVTSGKYILLNDAADDEVYCNSEPSINQWQLAMESLSEKQKEAGGNRNAVSELLQNLPSSWQVLDDQTVNLKINKNDHLSFAQYILSGANLLPSFFGMDVDCEKLKDEVVSWYINNNSSATFKFRWVLLKRL